MRLQQTIKQHYFDNLENLPTDKQFHFASRIAAWEGDRKAFSLLTQLKSFMVPSIEPQGLSRMLKEIAEKPQTGRRNAHNLRFPFFEKYPKLYGLHSALFRVRHLKYIYGVDAREALFHLFPQKTIEDLLNQLWGDEEALRVLSTFAVNTTYLYKKMLLGQENSVDVQHFIEASKGYNHTDKTQLQLKIYLFTHCIICETNFYTEKITTHQFSKLIYMLEEMEKDIGENFEVINLDNKLEFLVCARICDYSSDLFEKIYDECQRSLSQKGNFLIDRHNQHAQKDRATFEKSEHRNVLYIMSSSPYSPHSTLLV